MTTRKGVKPGRRKQKDGRYKGKPSKFYNTETKTWRESPNKSKGYRRKGGKEL